MPFELKNAPTILQRDMHTCLQELIVNTCYIYLEDIIMYFESYERKNYRTLSSSSKRIIQNPA